MIKLGNRIVKVTLIVLILLSLFLSWKIWTKPANRGFQDRSNKVSEVVQKKPMTDVFVPTKLFYHENKGEDFFYTNKESVISSLQERVVNFEFGDIKELTRTEAAALLEKEQIFSLVFPSEIPVALFTELHHLDLELPEEHKNMVFSRVTVSLLDETLYFVNHAKTEAIEVPVKGDFKSLERLLQSKKNGYFKVNAPEDSLINIYYFTEEVELKIYSYIVATQSFTTFSKGFFNQSSDLYSNEGENLNLSNGEGESLTIENKTGEVTYFGKLQENHNQVSNKLYYDTFQYVENMGSALGNMRYFSSKENEVTYRNYVEGFPVFGENMQGSLEATVQNKNIYIRANQETLQIPIPSEENVTLIPTAKLVEQLRDQGVDLDSIQDIQIGYKWQTNKETKQAVDLVPEWYIKYNNEWYTQPEVVEVATKGGGQ